MYAYRVDKRLFEVDDVVLPTNEYIPKLDPHRIQVESCLENTRPDEKLSRYRALFVFECRRAAERFWTKEEKGKLYKFELMAPLRHRGDMSFTDMMFGLRANTTRVRDIAGRYWRVDKSKFPQIELLIEQAIVISVIYTTEEERRFAFAERAGIPLPYNDLGE